MPKLKIVEAQTVREVVGKADFLAQELNDFNRLAEGNYVADIGESQYLSTVITLTRLIEQAAGMMRHYHHKMFLVQQENEIREAYKARRGNGADPLSKPTLELEANAPATASDKPASRRVRL